MGGSVARSRSRLAAAAAGLALAAGSGCAGVPWRDPGQLVGRVPRELGPGQLVVHVPGEPEPGQSWVLYLEPDSGHAGAPRTALVQVASRGSSFRPLLTVVQVGDQIQFVNEGAVTHRLFTAGEGERRERLVGALGRSEWLSISKPGENRFYCSLHPDESFVVFASPSPWFAVLAPAEERRIAGIPSGSYRLTLWSEAGLHPLGPLEIHSGVATAYTLPDRSRAGD